MPTIRTGNQEWDQSLNTLGAALFPDPSKAAQGYYYGSQARQSQLESNKLIDQGNYRARYGMMTQGGAQPGPLTFQQPQNIPGAPPISAPPVNLPMAGAGPTGLGAVVQAASNMTPQQAADLVPAAVAPMTQGTPAPVGPPSAVSPPAPQTTTSNGQVPQNDYTSGTLHPASINMTGVPVQASPAQANGSPAQVPPGMTLPSMLAMHSAGALAGIDAATLAGGGAALAYELRSRKIINDNQYNQMLAGTGTPQPLVADIGAAATLGSANIQAGAHVKGAQIAAGASTANQAMQTAESKRQFDETPVQTVVDGKPVYTTRAKAIAAGLPYYDPQLASTQQQGANTLANTVAQAANTIGDYVNPAFPTVVLKRTKAEADAQGLRAVTSADVQNAVGQAAIMAAPTDADAAAIAARRELAAPPAKTAAQDNDDYNQRQILINQQLATAMPAAVQKGIFGGTSSTQDAPAGAPSPELGHVLNDLTNQYMRTGPTKGDPINSANAAIAQLIDEKRLKLDQPRTKMINIPVTDPKTNVTTQVPRFQVDLHDEAGNVVPAGTRARIIAKPLSTVVVPGGGPTTGAPAATATPPVTTAAPPAGPAAVPPGTPIGQARAGTPDGPATIGGKPVDVRGGVIYSR